MSFAWWDVPRKGWMLIFTQFSIILFLTGWLYAEYLNNPFMQQYLSNIAPTVVPVLSVAFGGIAAMTATTLYIHVRRSRLDEQDLANRSSQSSARKAAKKRANGPRGTTIKARTELPGGLPSPQFIITESKPAVEQKTETQPTPAPEPVPSPAPSAQPAPSQPQTTSATPETSPAPTNQQSAPSPQPAQPQASSSQASSSSPPVPVAPPEAKQGQ